MVSEFTGVYIRGKEKAENWLQMANPKASVNLLKPEKIA